MYLHVRLIAIVLVLVGLTGCLEKPEPEPKDELDHRLRVELPEASYEARQRVRELLHKVKKDLVFVKGGSFEMGDLGETYADGDWLQWTLNEDDNHVHTVTLDSYALSRYETTWGELRLYFDAIGVDPYKKGWWVGASRDPEDSFYHLKPADAPNWSVANNYCRWLGELAGLPLDLPTEAQWEYAARSRGKVVRFATNDGTLKEDVDGSLKGNYASNSRFLMPVGSYPPNPLGLYDMTGNEKEWVKDWYQPDYYEQSPAFNPKGPADGHKRSKVVRDWGAGAGFADIPTRGGISYDIDNTGIGFRCAANIKEPLPT